MIQMQIDSIRARVDYPQQRVVILKEMDVERYLPIWVGPVEADAIAVKLVGVNVPTPLPADFICALVDALEAKVQSVVISDIKGDTFYAKTIIEKNNKSLIEIDCRPADALAIAVRLQIPIFAEEEVLAKAAKVL